MRRSTLLAITAVLAIVTTSAVALADYRGPHGGETTVAEVLKNPKGDTTVLLRGSILRKVGPKKYIFSDGTGEIQVEIRSKLFPVEPVDDKTKVEITGEVEKDFRKTPEIDVDTLQILAPPN